MLVDSLSLDDHPSYAAAQAQLDQLQHKRATLTQELDVAKNALVKATTAAADVDARHLAGEPIDRVSLNGAVSEATAKAAALADDLATIDTLIARQNALLQQESVLAERAMLARVTDEYMGVHGAIVAAQETLTSAHYNERQYRATLAGKLAGPWSPHSPIARMNTHLAALTDGRRP